MNTFISGLFRFLLRLVLLAVGLVFVASLFVMIGVFAVIWLFSALLAKLSGRPAPPWQMRFNVRGQWNRFNQARPGPAATGAAPTRASQALPDITDVEPK